MDNEHNFDYEEGCEHGVYPHTWKKRQKQSMCMIMNRVKRRMNTLPVNTTIPYWWIRQYICVVPVIPMVGMLPVVAMRGHRFLVITIMRMRLSWELLVTTLVVADRISMRVFVIYRDVHLHHVLWINNNNTSRNNDNHDGDDERFVLHFISLWIVGVFIAKASTTTVTIG